MRRTGTTPDQIALAIAYIRREVTGEQVAEATGTWSNNVHSWVGSVLIRGVRQGLVTLTTNVPKETES